ncbi:MAG: SMC-Scp complex subunit ScpB [Pseudomonadota bacterium]
MSETANEIDAERNEEARRMIEAVLFATARPLALEEIAARLPEGIDVARLLHDLSSDYEARGVNLVAVAGKWQLRTAPDLAFLLREEVEETRKLSRAGVETLAIIAYHQPITRAEIEELRGVSLSKGTLDVLMEAGWVRPRGRKATPGRPVLYGTSDDFLAHFGLEKITDLPGLEELKASGMLDPIDDSLGVLLAAAGDDEGAEALVEDEEERPLT